MKSPENFLHNPLPKPRFILTALSETPYYLKAYFSPQQINHINFDPVMLKCFDKIYVISGVWQKRADLPGR